MMSSVCNDLEESLKKEMVKKDFCNYFNLVIMLVHFKGSFVPDPQLKRAPKATKSFSVVQDSLTKNINHSCVNAYNIVGNVVFVFVF